MSIFDPTSGMHSGDWLREKSLASLEVAVSLIDLANEPDTTPWYSKNLKQIANLLVSRLLPMTALLHGVGTQGVESGEWQNILDKGTFALTKWCRKWGVANPYRFRDGLTASPRDEAEIIEKNMIVKPLIITKDEEDSNLLKLEIYQNMALQMLNCELTVPAGRLLSYMLFHLNISDYADIVVLDKNFLPTDIGCSPQETSQAYEFLFQKGLIERVDGLKIRDRGIALRLVVEGINNSKHPPEFQEEKFGRPGLRIQGKPTIGNIFLVSLDKSQSKYLEWLARSPEKILRLGEFLQQSIGEDKVYIEEIRIFSESLPDGSRPDLEIEFRYPFEAMDDDLESQIKNKVEEWIKRSMK